MARTVDYSTYTLEELFQAESDIQQAIKNKQLERRKQALKQYNEIAQALGLTPQEILSGEKTKEKRARVRAKYQNPDNKRQTWSGRGPQPKWIKDLLATGKTIEELEI
jgi:DNA-binding protein H-NS